jgi:hypothetical protein
MPVGDVLKESTQQQQQIERTPEPKKKVESFPTIDALLDSYRKRNPNHTIEEKNAYTNPETKEADFYTLRIVPPEGNKTFRQVSKKAEGWQWTGLTGRTPIFNRQRIAECDRVLIVEGEKCVREFTKIGMENCAATTSPGGALNAAKADWSPLAGKKCYIWRDNDEPGKKYEADVIAALAKLTPPPAVYVVRVEELDLEPKRTSRTISMTMTRRTLRRSARSTSFWQTRPAST